VSITAALGGIVMSANEFCCDGGTAIVAFARRAGFPTHILPMPGKPNPQVPDFQINNVNAYHSRLREWLRSFHGVATKKNLPNYLGWRCTLEALGQNACLRTSSSALSDSGHINNQRHCSNRFNMFKERPATDSRDSICSRMDTQSWVETTMYRYKTVIGRRL
jgi:hypothetical protein